MSASAHLKRRRSQLAIWIAIVGACYVVTALTLPYFLEHARSLEIFRSPYRSSSKPPGYDILMSVARYGSLVLGVLITIFGKWVAVFFLPAYSPPFQLRPEASPGIHEPDRTLWIKMLTDARRPWRLLLLGTVLLLLAVEPVLLIVIALLDPLLHGPRLIITPFTVFYAYLLLLPGLAAFVWGALLWWGAFTDRRDLRKLVRMRY